MLDPGIPIPASGRTFSGTRRSRSPARRRSRRPGGTGRRPSSSCPTHRPARPPNRARCVTDIDLHGHVNAVHWQAVEQLLPTGGVDPRRPLVAELDYREPIDLDNGVELVAAPGGRKLLVGFRKREAISAAARIEAR